MLKELLSNAKLPCTVSNERTVVRCIFGSVGLSKWLRENFGTCAENKRIPIWLHEASEDYRLAFLDGYAMADGHMANKYRDQVWTTISKQFAIGIKILCNQSGFATSLRYTDAKDHRKKKLTIEGRSVNEKPFFNVSCRFSFRSYKFDELHGIGLVRKVEKLENKHVVYNISVDEDESYTADGLVVHNCQSFSTAGLRKGFEDERHLFPVFYNLTKECRFPVILGEQVSSKDGLAWFEFVQNSMEKAGYACGAMDTCAAGVGAPHIRQRLYWSAINLQGLGNTPCIGWTKGLQTGQNRKFLEWGSTELRTGFTGNCPSDRLGDTDKQGLEGQPYNECESQGRQNQARSIAKAGDSISGTNENHTFWSDCDWLYCRDQKFRPIEPSIVPLVDGTSEGVGLRRSAGQTEAGELESFEAGKMRLHGYGNAICAPVATMYISCVMDFLHSDLLKDMLR